MLVGLTWDELSECEVLAMGYFAFRKGVPICTAPRDGCAETGPIIFLHSATHAFSGLLFTVGRTSGRPGPIWGMRELDIVLVCNPNAPFFWRAPPQKRLCSHYV